jgi:small subunit ribosomal protein S9
MAKKIKKNFTYALGRRRTASARVRLYRGEGEHMVNGQVIGKYFPGSAMQAVWNKPFDITHTIGKYYITVKVTGGGRNGQLDAVAMGTARTLARVKDDFKKDLRTAGLLTTDPRTRERRKVGMGGKARRKKQSPKR